MTVCMELLEAIIKAKIFEDEDYFLPKLQIANNAIFHGLVMRDTCAWLRRF